MGKIFNIVLAVEGKEVLITLNQDARLLPQINLGGADYGIKYAGPAEEFEKIKIALMQYHANENAATKTSLESSLQSLGIVAVSDTSEKLQRSLKVASQIGRGMQAIQNHRSHIQTPDAPHGRMVLDHFYMEAQKKGDEKVYLSQKQLLTYFWKLDKSTPLSLSEWEKYQQAKWTQSKSDD